MTSNELDLLRKRGTDALFVASNEAHFFMKKNHKHEVELKALYSMLLLFGIITHSKSIKKQFSKINFLDFAKKHFYFFLVVSFNKSNPTPTQRRMKNRENKLLQASELKRFEKITYFFKKAYICTNYRFEKSIINKIN